MITSIQKNCKCCISNRPMALQQVVGASRPWPSVWSDEFGNFALKLPRGEYKNGQLVPTQNPTDVLDQALEYKHN